jgi:RsiW-degrading membrane proteinase PrsW (M82 family)|tara:strand:- start:320 stop:1006 length:687 start_codon:yes stop_codon:yes gene_type:complete
MTLLITVLPSLALVFYFVKSDKFKEPNRFIIITFLFGILINIPAGFLNDLIDKNFATGERFNDALLTGFFAGGPVEELLKFLVLYFYILKEKAFNEPMDGLVYGILASLGFATYENYNYVFIYAGIWEVIPMDLAIGRSYSAIPLHGLCGAIMGFYFGQYAFSANKKYLGLAIIVPIIFHGSYNFMCSYNWYYALSIVAIGFIFALLLHRNLKLHQKEKNKEHEDKKI